MGREEDDSNFEQLPFQVRKRDDLTVIMDLCKLIQAHMELVGSIEAKGERASSGKRGCCEKDRILITIGNIYN
ncbi:hypothetical protein QD47_27380 [Paenibacillus terrae]|uniref:Uncharacterized protein n=2 Tax=Paenibacillus terrae TaxID=159743 RepID=A0A0D7WU94_9BACL|nr:hypothetical protein QD47_27380 [Paenibacillus terrae]